MSSTWIPGSPMSFMSVSKPKPIEPPFTRAWNSLSPVDNAWNCCVVLELRIQCLPCMTVALDVDFLVDKQPPKSLSVHT